MKTAQEKSAINRMLGSHGLPPLESGAGLMAALGFMIQDHEHLRSILVRCEPEERSNCYNSLKPYLRFAAKPLDVYIAESQQRAERMQLPTLDPDGKDFHWPVTQNIETDVADLAAAQKAVNFEFAAERLVMRCKHCTREEVFTGDTKDDAILNARQAGWISYRLGDEMRAVCPKCPATREEFLKLKPAA